MALISSNGTGGGNWSVAGTWIGGVPPAEGDCATVVVGDTVTIDDAAPANVIIGDDHVGAAYAITINGKLQYLSTAAVDHVFRCKGDLVVASGGSLEIGTAANPIPAARTFTIELNYSAALADGKYGLKNSGDMILQGDPARITVTKCMLNADAAINATSLTTDVATGWKDNDDIAIASTTRTWTEAENGKMNGDAVGAALTVDGFGGAAGGLANAHDGSDNAIGDSVRAEIINLTRNVKVTSFNAAFEGYVLVDVDSTCDIDYVEFYELGMDAVDKYGFVCKTVATSNVHYSSFYNMYDGLSIPRHYSDLLTFDHNVIYDIMNLGIYADAAEGEVITNNIVMKATSYGIYFGRPTLDGRGNVITSCSNGIYCYSYNPINLDDITIHSSGYSTLYLIPSPSYNTISNWRIWRNSSYLRFILSGWSFSNWLNFGCAFRYTGNLNTYISLRMYNEVAYSNNYGWDWDGGLKAKFIDCEIGVNGTYPNGDFTLSGLSGIIFRNCKISSPTNFHNMSGASAGTSIEIEDYDQVQYQDLGWYKYGKVIRDSTIKKTSSYSMRFDQFWIADDWLEYEVQIPVKDGESVVISAWLRKNAAYTSANRPKIKMSGMGITATEDQMSDVTDVWERVSVSGTPTRTGMAKLTIMTYLTNAGASAWCDFEKTGLTMPVLNTLEGDFWADGHIAQILFDTGSITAAEFWKTLTADIDKAGSYGNLFKDYLDAQISLIKAQTDKLQFAAGNDIKATLDGEKVALSGATEAEIDRILTATEIKQAAVNDTSATTTKFVTNLTETSNDFWNRMAVLFTSGNNIGQMRRIKNYTGTTKEITVQTPLDVAPANADTFIIPSARAFLTVDIADIVDAVWDEVLTGATHNIATSAGRRVRQLSNICIRCERAQGGSSCCITLDAGASNIDGIYNRNYIVIVEGSGVGQTREIAEYAGSTKVAHVAREWKVIPDDTSEFQILANDTLLISNHGIAQGGSTADTITLEASASAEDNIYKKSLICISTGTGCCQARLITAYNGTTKVATVSPNWAIVPDSTSVYKVIPQSAVYVEELLTCAKANVADAVLDEQLDQHTDAGSLGEKLHGIRVRPPAPSPWSKKQIERLFKLLNDILNQPSPEEVNLGPLHDSIKELHDLAKSESVALKESTIKSLQSMSQQIAELPSKEKKVELPDSLINLNKEVCETIKSLELEPPQQDLSKIMNALEKLNQLLLFPFLKSLSTETLEKYLSSEEQGKNNG